MNQCAETVVAFIGDTHRPVAILMVTFSFVYAVLTKQDPAALGAIGLVLGGLFWGKSAENMAQTKADASVKKAAAQ